MQTKNNPQSKQTIHIIGAGALGSLWAAMLSKHFEVKFIGRPGHASKTQTFTFEQEGQRQTFELEQVEPSRIETLSTLLVFTKSYDVMPALEGLSKLTEDTSMVLFQNGLGSQSQVVERWPNRQIYAATTTEGANKPEPTVVVHAGRGRTVLGGLTESASDADRLEALRSMLAASGLVVESSQDIWEALWNKLAINCAINPYTALFNCPNGQIPTHEYFQQTWPALIKELRSMLSQAGYPQNETKLENTIQQVIQNTATNISSMLQDQCAGRRTEIDDINGFAARYLAQHGLENEVNDVLWQKVRDLQN